MENTKIRMLLTSLNEAKRKAVSLSSSRCDLTLSKNLSTVNSQTINNHEVSESLLNEQALPPIKDSYSSQRDRRIEKIPGTKKMAVSSFTPRKAKPNVHFYNNIILSMGQKMKNVQNLREFSIQSYRSKEIQKQQNKTEIKSIIKLNLISNQSPREEEEKEESPQKKIKKEEKKPSKKSPAKIHGSFRKRQWFSKKSINQRIKSPKRKRSPKKRKESDILPWDTIDDEMDILF